MRRIVDNRIFVCQKCRHTATVEFQSVWKWQKKEEIWYWTSVWPILSWFLLLSLIKSQFSSMTAFTQIRFKFWVRKKKTEYIPHGLLKTQSPQLTIDINSFYLMLNYLKVINLINFHCMDFIHLYLIYYFLSILFTNKDVETRSNIATSKSIRFSVVAIINVMCVLIMR